MTIIKKVAVLAVLMASLPALACKIKLVNDNTDHSKNLRILVNDESAADLNEGIVKGKTLRRLSSKKVEPCKKRDLGSKYKLNVLYVYEKVAQNQYKLTAIVNQTAQAGRGQEILLSLSDLKAGSYDKKLLQVTLK